MCCFLGSSQFPGCLNVFFIGLSNQSCLKGTASFIVLPKGCSTCLHELHVRVAYPVGYRGNDASDQTEWRVTTYVWNITRVEEGKRANWELTELTGAVCRLHRFLTSTCCSWHHSSRKDFWNECPLVHPPSTSPPLHQRSSILSACVSLPPVVTQPDPHCYAHAADCIRPHVVSECTHKNLTKNMTKCVSGRRLLLYL